MANILGSQVNLEDAYVHQSHKSEAEMASLDFPHCFGSSERRTLVEGNAVMQNYRGEDLPGKDAQGPSD